MMHHLPIGLFASKFHETGLFLARTGEREFVASHQIPKNTISPSTRCTEKIKMVKYFVFTASIRYEAVYYVPSIQ